MGVHPDGWEQKITVGQAFSAVAELVRMYWETGGKAEEGVADFGSAIRDDPALKLDWVKAVNKALG